MNLVAPSTMGDLHKRHFDDSFQLHPLLPDNAAIIYDLGSGAGFPGMVLAINNPERSFHLIESHQRKAGFLQTLRRELELTNVTIHPERIENCVRPLPAPDLITARALTELENILDLTSAWAAKNLELTYILPKGAQAEKEIEAARKRFLFDIKDTPSQTDKNSRILYLSSVRQR